MNIDEKPRLPLLDQRELEARIVGPLIRAFASEIGEERALVIVREVIAGLARKVAPSWLRYWVSGRSMRLPNPWGDGVRTERLRWRSWNNLPGSSHSM